MLSRELGIPSDLTEALYLLSEGAIRSLDMGAAGDQLFFHMGIGFEAEMQKRADRRSKERSGTLAYIFSALRELRSPPTALFRLELDGQIVEMEGINCPVTTFGSIGGPGLLSKTIDVSDGLLDVTSLCRFQYVFCRQPRAASRESSPMPHTGRSARRASPPSRRSRSPVTASWSISMTCRSG